MTRTAGRALLAALALGSAGCSGCSDDTAAPADLVFVPAASTESPAIYVQAQSAPAGRLWLDVRGRGLADLYGLALRLEYDGAALSAASMSPSAFWPDDALSAMAQPAAGLLVGGISRRGPVAGAPADDDSLCRLDFAMSEATPLRFVPGHVAVVGTDGSEMDGVAWLGGELVWQ